jgi:molybdate transport system substrate-binding protein
MKLSARNVLKGTVAMVCFVAFALHSSRVSSEETGRESMQTIQVFAAASTTNAIHEITRQFTKDTGVQVQTSFGSSAILAKQIVNGADADVFISADVGWVDYLAKQRLVVREKKLLGNRLVLIVPNDSTLKVQQPEDLLAVEIQHLALADPESVPAGKYAKQALMKLGIWEKLKPKVAAAEDVRGALTYVETGAAEAGIVYATDAAISTKVKVAAEIAKSLTGPICYPIALLKHGKDSSAAESFYRQLQLPESLKIFQKYGFTTLAEPETTAKPSE